MKSFFKKIKSIPFEISTELVKKTAICKYDFASAKKEERFEIVYPAFAEMLSVPGSIGSARYPSIIIFFCFLLIT